MTSESYITKLYFKKYFLILFPIALIISGAGFFFCFLAMNGKHLSAFILMCIFCIGISLIIPASLAHEDKKKGTEAYRLFRSEGFTCSFCDTYRKAYINSENPFPPHIVMCVAYYMRISEYDTASMLLNKIENPAILDSHSRFIYFLEMLTLCGKTGNWSRGEEIRRKNIGFIQNYVRKKKNNPEYRVNMSIALALVDCSHGRYADAFTLLNSGYRPKDKNDENFLNILINAVYIYSQAKNDENLHNAIHNAVTFLNNFTEFDFPWRKDYYKEQIRKASKGTL